MANKLKIIECPRDAMQGIAQFIPTEHKLNYLNKLLKVGFDTLDFGSFVSAKAIPQMADTANLPTQLELDNTETKLLAIIANIRGARDAAAFKEIQYLGYPISISETFQIKNTNKSIFDSLEDLIVISQICKDNNKELVLYMSMGFGNPYGDAYHSDMVLQFADVLASLGASVVSLADTVGLASPGQISELFKAVKAIDSKVEWGVHLHASKTEASDKIMAALEAGCRRIDGAILGYGGCPMAKNDLVGNIDTRQILVAANSLRLETNINHAAFDEAEKLAVNIFN